MFSKVLILIASIPFFYLGISLNANEVGIGVKNAKRIVALSPHSVEMLFAIGAGDKIIGTVEYADYPEEAKSILRIGSYHGIQIENLLALEPDLVIGWKSGNKSGDLDKIESLGIKIIYSQPKTIEDIGNELIELGQITGNVDKANQVVDKLVKRYHKILKSYKSLVPVSVFYQLWHDPLQSVGKDSWIAHLIESCGGKNIFDEASAPYPLVSVESVLVKNPKVIIIPSHSGNQKEFPEKSKVWKKWQDISAVEHNRIYGMNGDLLHRFTPRALDGLEQLCLNINEGRSIK